MSNLKPEDQQKIAPYCTSENNFDKTDATMQCVNDTFPAAIESIENVKMRCDAYQKFMQEFIKTQDVGANVDQGKIAMVTHSMFLRIYTTEDVYWTRDYPSQPNPLPHQYHTMMNCEVYPDLRF